MLTIDIFFPRPPDATLPFWSHSLHPESSVAQSAMVKWGFTPPFLTSAVLGNWKTLTIRFFSADSLGRSDSHPAWAEAARAATSHTTRSAMLGICLSDDDVYYYICQRLKLEGETENMRVCTKERKGDTAEVLMATPCTNSLGGESWGQKHEGCGGTGFAGSLPSFLGRERAACGGPCTNCCQLREREF